MEKEHIGWTEPIFHPVYSYNGTQALVRLPVKDGANGHYMHACQVFNSNVVPLTHGAFEITKILGWDEEKHILWVLFSFHEYAYIYIECYIQMESIW